MYKCSSMPLNSIKAPMSFLSSNFGIFPSYVIILSLLLFRFQNQMQVYLYKCKVNNIFFISRSYVGFSRRCRVERGKNKVGGNRLDQKEQMDFHAAFKLHLSLLIWMGFPYTSGLFLSVFWETS